MEEDSTVVATYVFRGIEYIVTMNVLHGSNLVVEVEDRLTADQWRGSFDVAYIEDLTHKTGNFKQFPIFINMLESAIVQSSDSVTMDLLTYSDLESLRNRKAGTGRPNIPGAKNAASLNSKRYLILTYTVEFDRIHYPLPLPYMGKPDPRALQETIRQLRVEVKQLKQLGAKDHKSKEADKIKRNYDKLLQEKEELQEQFVDFKRQVQNTREGTAVKEIRILKSVVQNLEEELMKEKNKHQKLTFRRNQEFKKMSDELDELKASERNLKVRVKSLTNEIAIYKRRSRPMNGTSPRGRDTSGHSSYLRDRPSSRASSRHSSRENSLTRESSRLSSRSKDRLYNNRDRSLTKDKDRSRTSKDGSLSKERSRLSADRSRLSDRSQPRDRSSSRDRISFRDRTAPKTGSFSRERSSSRERLYSLGTRGRSLERDRGGTRSRTPSPFAARPRFDPTSYVKEQTRKRRESELRQKREVRSRLNGSAERPKSSPAASDRSAGRTRVVRSSSYGSLRSRTSSIESLSDIGMASDTSEGRRRRNGTLKPPKSRSNNVPSSPEISFTKPPTSKTQKILASTPEQQPRSRRQRAWEKENKQPRNGDNDYFDRSAEISEIDARLDKLQQFMKTNLV